jgi:NAD(P)-dependent dehydrogenase (short-subunit alcohol dehydrogenase family)
VQALGLLGWRVTPLTLGVTNAAQTEGAVERVESLDILINNAGLGLYSVNLSTTTKPFTAAPSKSPNLFQVNLITKGKGQPNQNEQIANKHGLENS